MLGNHDDDDDVDGDDYYNEDEGDDEYVDLGKTLRAPPSDGSHLVLFDQSSPPSRVGSSTLMLEINYVHCHPLFWF